MFTPSDEEQWLEAKSQIQEKLTPEEKGHIEFPLRLYEPGDSGVVIKTWMDHVRSMAPFKGWPKEAVKRHELVLERLVEAHRPVLVCGAEDSLVKGWICADSERDVLHFLYVRNAWRQYGIGTALMKVNFPGFKKRPIWHTHPGRSVKHLRQKWMLVHNPYLVENTCASRQ